MAETRPLIQTASGVVHAQPVYYPQEDAAGNPITQPSGGGGGGGGGAATIADGADVAQGAKDNAKATDTSSPWSIISLLKGILDVFLQPASDVASYGSMRTTAAGFKTRTQVTASGADTDELLPAAGSGLRQMIGGGWIQTDIAGVLTFKSGATPIAIFKLGVDGFLDLELSDDQEPRIYTAPNEALNVTKSANMTLTGTLFSKTGG